MCVAVTLAPGTFLDKQEVIKMDRANADGVGVAWASDGIVEWYKTIKVDPEYITNMIYSFRELPRIVHFRYSTAGGTRPELCHPFEIGPMANCDPEGMSTRVMMHNGHWHKWEEVKKLLDREGLLPEGPWSDSRLAAFLANMDPDWLNEIGGRVGVMLGTGEIHRIGAWEQLREGIYVSNKAWETATVPRGGYTGFRHWKGWAWAEGEYEAFLADQQRKEDAEMAALIKEAETYEQENSKRRETNAERRERKRSERKAKRDGKCGEGEDCEPTESGSCSLDSGGSTGLAKQEVQPDVIIDNNCRIVRSGYCESHRTFGPHDSKQAIDWEPTPEQLKVSDEPTQASNGRWYRAVQIGGVKEVVEVLPPTTKS